MLRTLAAYLSGMGVLHRFGRAQRDPMSAWVSNTPGQVRWVSPTLPNLRHYPSRCPAADSAATPLLVVLGTLGGIGLVVGPFGLLVPGPGISWRCARLLPWA